VQTLDQRVIEVIGAHSLVRSIELVGSRAEGGATAHSDWDFGIETDDFAALADELPALCATLNPIAQQWDRLSSRYCWMLMLPGPRKIDLIFADQPHQLEPPWEPTPKNLIGIDLHFWDWMLWLSSKEAAGKHDLVASELEKLYQHLLAPLGAEQAPLAVPAAVTAYRHVRAEAERHFAVQVPRNLEHAVASAVTGTAMWLHPTSSHCDGNHREEACGSTNKSS
jgi:hypothetical protein